MNKIIILLSLIILNLIYVRDLGAVIFSDASQVEIVFMDVGQGDSILIKDHKTIGLIDAGPNNNISYQIDKFIPKSRTTLDFAIATHLDKDHIEGFLSILDRFKINKFFINTSSKDNELIKELKNKLVLTNTTTYELFSENDFETENLYFDVLWPLKDASEKESNENSVAILIKYNKISMFTAGDLGRINEMKSLEKFLDEDIDTNILKIGHHGSKTSTSQDLINFIEPEVAIIPVGKDNSYGHPALDTLDLLEANNIKVLRTDQLHNIKLKTNGFSYTIL